MKFHVANRYPRKLDALVVGIGADKGLAASLRAIDDEVGARVSSELKRRQFTGELATTATVPLPTGSLAHHVIVVGLGSEPIGFERSRRAAAAINQEAARHHTISLAMRFPAGAHSSEVIGAVVEGLLLSEYHFDKHKQAAKRQTRELTVVCPTALEFSAKQAIRHATHTAAATCLARDLANEPPSLMTPRQLAYDARRIAKQSGLAVRVLGPTELKRLGFGATLAVARGSDQPPQFIQIRYRPRGAKRHVVLAGKGITFDAGGLNLKPAKGGGLEDMKMDMAGAAAVIGAMSVLKKLGIKVAVTGYIAATENLLGGSAYKPGDVVRAYNGKTIEVLNTDAEGRLTLADVLSYAEQRDKPDAMIDLATLTATEVSLGTDYAALFGTDPDLTQQLVKAGTLSGEQVWPMPLPDEYQETVKGTVADLRNIGTDRGYSINGAVFLRNFVRQTPWAHIDIGSPAMTGRDRHYHKTGATGFGARLLLAYLTQVAKHG